MNKTVTLVIPTYTITYELRDLAYKCALSHKKHVDKIIIVEDGGMHSNQLREIADIYLYSCHNIGFTKNVNRGWRLSDTDITIIANSDTELVGGNIKDMYESEHIVCPEFINMDNKNFTGAYFVVPNTLRKKFGMLDERMRTFVSDVDYGIRVKEYYRFEPRVKILHHKAKTLQATHTDTQVESKKDSEIYHNIVNLEYPDRINWK